MLKQEELEEYKALAEKGEQAKADMQSMKTEVALMKKQQLAKLNEKYGYTSFADLPKLKEKIDSMEQEVLASKEEYKKYITYVAETKEAKENIMVG